MPTRRGRPSTFTQRTATRSSTTRPCSSAIYAQDDIRLRQEPVAQRRPPSGDPDPSRRLAESRAAHRRDVVAVQERRDHLPRRRRDLLRLVRRSDATSRHCALTASIKSTLPFSIPVIPTRWPAAASSCCPRAESCRRRISCSRRSCRTNVAVEQAFGKYARVNVLYGYARSHTALRGHDINAPLSGGERPDPSSGTVTQVESTARSSGQMLHTGAQPEPAVAPDVPVRELHARPGDERGRRRRSACPADNQNLRRRVGTDAVRRAASRLGDVQHESLEGIQARHDGQQQLRAALQRHDRVRRQPRHREQRSARGRGSQQRARRRALGFRRHD